MQADAPSLSAFSVCRGRTFLLSSRSVPFPQESSSLLLFGSPALATIPHWFIFVMFCLLQTDILPLFSLGFCFFFPAHCINRMEILPFCPQVTLLWAEKCLFWFVLCLQITFWSSSFFLKCTCRTRFFSFGAWRRLFHSCVSFLVFWENTLFVILRHKVLLELPKNCFRFFPLSLLCCITYSTAS